MSAQLRSHSRTVSKAFGDIEWIEDTFLHLFDEDAPRQALNHTIWPREPGKDYMGFWFWTTLAERAELRLGHVPEFTPAASGSQAKKFPEIS